MTTDGADVPLLRVRDLVLTATRDERPVRLVDGVSFDLARGEALGLVGESGSGKSLTLRAVMGLLPTGVTLESGSIAFEGREVTSLPDRDRRRLRGRRIAMVFQDPMTALNPVMTVGDQVAEGPRTQLGLSRRDAAARAVELMSDVGIPHAASRARAYPHEFSGGMRQRVMIAIALSSAPSLLLCDEPTTALDVTIQEQILTIFAGLRETSELALLFVTHDLAVVAQLCERIAVMYAGEIVETGPTAEVFRRPRHSYTLGLLRSVPDVHVTLDRLATIAGLPPDLTDLPPGCRFAARCELADEPCLQTVALRVDADGRAHRCVHSDLIEDFAARRPVVTGG